MCFVGFSKQPLTASELIALLQQELFSTSSSYYFLRWQHRVGGFWQRRNDFADLAADIRDRLYNHPVNNFTPKQPETFPSPEGQLFNSTLELRWKQAGDKYRVLILSSRKSEPDFQRIERDWQFSEQSAIVHRSTETRFPKALNSDKVNIAQRYFSDRATATVHFVALTVKSS